MKSIIGYTCGWLLMPILAIRHKFLSIKGYVVEVDKGESLIASNYIEAIYYFDAVVAHGMYGDYCRVVQINKYSPPTTIIKIEW